MTLKERFRHAEKDFTRKKKLTFSITLLIMSNFIRKSLSLEIVIFVNIFNEVNSTKLSSFTQSAFIQSRNKIKPQARISILYDVLNNLVIVSKLVPLKIGEIPLAKEHLLEAKKNDLIIYDRGYPSFELVNSHNNLEVDFLFRVKVGFSNVIKDFVSGRKTSQVVEIKPSKKNS